MLRDGFLQPRTLFFSQMLTESDFLEKISSGMSSGGSSAVLGPPSDPVVEAGSS